MPVKASKPKTHNGLFWRFLPFWIFLIFFKFGGALHYTLLSPLGERLLPLWLVGLLIGGESLIQLLLDVPAGYLLDRFGYLRLLKLTTFFFMLAVACWILGLTTATYLISIALVILGWLFFGPGVNAYILSHAPKQQSGRFFSYRDIFGSIGVVLSSAALPFVLLLAPHDIGTILLALMAWALLMLFLCPRDTAKADAETKLPTQHYYRRRSSWRDIFRVMRKLNPASTMLTLLNLSGSTFYGIIWFTVPLVIAHQAHAGLLGLGLGIFDFAVVALGFFLGNLADKGNKRALVFFGLLLFAVSGMLLGLDFGWLFLLFGFLATSGDEMAGLSLWSWLHSLDKEHAHDGAVAGILNLFDDLGWAVGPMLAGFLYEWLGASWTIALGAVPIFLVWLAYQFLFRLHPAVISASIPRKPHRRRHKM